MTSLPLNLIHIGGPTVVFDWAGLRVLSDPTFDPPGDYPSGPVVLTKTTSPALAPDELGLIDLVLLSHDQHPDNLDRLGRKLLDEAPLALSTPEAADRIPNATGLASWESHQVTTPGGQIATITAVPARHGPPGCEPATGTVTGFHLAAAGEPSVYISGDNAALELVAETVDRLGPVDVAVLHLGAARVPLLDADLTLNAADAVAAANLLNPATIIAVHSEGWAHFTESPKEIVAAFAAAGLSDRLASV